MSSIKLLPIVLCIVTLAFSLSVKASEYNLQINAEGFNQENGAGLYYLYLNGKGFPGDTEKASKQGKFEFKDGKAIVTVADVPKGEYAAIVVHDENKNGKFDTNFIGFPKEGVGNSNNHKGRPKYSKSRIDFNGDKKITIKLWYP